MVNLQRATELKTKKEKDLYYKTIKEIYDNVEESQFNPKRNLNLDRSRQHKIKISKIIVKGKVNPQVKAWLNNSTRGDIVSIDDVPKDIIKKLRYGDNLLTKKERKLLSMIRKINNKRSEKELIKDLMGNEKILPLKDWKKWEKNKKKYDIQGVDTIPDAAGSKAASTISRLRKTTSDDRPRKYTRRAASNKGVFMHRKDTITGLMKSRTIKINRLIKGSKSSHATISHEIGHSYDLLKNKFKKPSEEVIKDMKKLAEKINPPIMSFSRYENLSLAEESNLPKGIKKYMEYRLSHKELFADAFSYLAYDVAYAKKNARNFYNYVIKRDPKLKSILGKEKAKVVTKIVKTIKKDKVYLEKEKKKLKIKSIQDEIKKLKSRKRIGPKTKDKIKTLETKIKKLRS